MNKKYVGLLLCILSFSISIIATILVILAAYNKSTPLVVVGLVLYFMCFITIVFGGIMIYKGFKNEV